LSFPKDQSALIYCNTGSLSAQAGFALRVAGYENVRILQGCFDGWKNKGGVMLRPSIYGRPGYPDKTSYLRVLAYEF
jgi:3-mercaptopyruvate sulfurtransferase SseA